MARTEIKSRIFANHRIAMRSVWLKIFRQKLQLLRRKKIFLYKPFTNYIARIFILYL